MRNIKRVYASEGDGGAVKENLGSVMRRTSTNMGVRNNKEIAYYRGKAETQIYSSSTVLTV